MHGNEQVGIMVFNKIQEHKIDFNGRLLGLLGNKSAVAINKRYVDYDLNRVWTTQKMGQLWEADRISKAEDGELKELKYYIDGFFDQAIGRKVLIDLHATSSGDGNFIVIPEDESNHPIVKALHHPIVIDLEKYIEGTLLDYYHNQGVVSFAFEGGLIGSPRALQLHEAGLWETLKVAGSYRQS